MPSSLRTLQARLTLLILLAIIPSLGLSLYSGLEQRKQASEKARQEALSIVRQVTTDQQQTISIVYNLLNTISLIPQVRHPVPSLCTQILASQVLQNNAFTSLSVVDTEGQVLCSSKPLQETLYLKDRPWLENAINSGRFTIGSYEVDDITGQGHVPVAYPITDNRGRTLQIFTSGISLRWFSWLSGNIHLPEGSALTIFDSHGTILVRQPDPLDWVGKNLSDTSLFRTIQEQGEGTAELDGVDHVSRLYAFYTLQEADKPAFYISFGIPLEKAYNEADRITAGNLTGLGMVIILAIAAAWLGGEVFIRRPVQRLTSATRRLAGGDLSARADIPNDAGEIGTLGQHFNRMAEVLEQRQLELKQSNRALQFRLDELAVLHTIAVNAVEATDVDDLIQRTTTIIGHTLYPDNFGILLVDETAGVLKMHSTYQIDKASWLDTVPLGKGIVGSVFNTGKPRRTGNVHLEPGYIAGDKNTLSEMCVPLRVGDQVLGVINTESIMADAFTESDEHLLTTLAGQLATAIERLRAQAEIKRMATYDELTGLYNRRHFLELAEREINFARRFDRRFSLILIDIDHFKQVNDSYGHATGDSVLRAISQRLKAIIRDVDLFGRYGGDEFIAVLTETNLEQALGIAERLRQCVADSLFGTCNGQEAHITISLGVVEYARSDTDLACLIDRADTAMYTAKQHGRNRTTCG